MPRLTLFDGSLIIARLHLTRPDGECTLDRVLDEGKHEYSTIDSRCSTTVRVRNDERLSASINLFHVLKQRQNSNLDKNYYTAYRYETRIFVNDECVGQRSFTMEELGDLKSTIFTPPICMSPRTRVLRLQVCETESRPSGRQDSTTHHFEFHCSTGSETFHHVNTPVHRACTQREMERVTKKSNRPWYTGGETQGTQADYPPPSLMQRLSVSVSDTAQPLSARLSELPLRGRAALEQTGRRSVSLDSSDPRCQSMGEHVARKRSSLTEHKRQEATTRSDETMDTLQERGKSPKRQCREGLGLEGLEEQFALERSQKGNAQHESAHNRFSRVEQPHEEANDPRQSLLLPYDHDESQRAAKESALDYTGVIPEPHTPQRARQDSQKKTGSLLRPEPGKVSDHEPPMEVCSYQQELPPRPDADIDTEQSGSKRGRVQEEKRSIEYYKEKRAKFEAHRKILEVEKEKLLVLEEVDRCRELEQELQRLRKRKSESLRTEARMTPDDAHFSRLLVSRPIPSKDATLTLNLDKHGNEQLQQSISNAAADERPYSPQSMKSHSDDGHRQSPTLLSSGPTLPAPLMRNR